MNKLIAYSIDFASFLIERIGTNKIKTIVLFGSVAREEASSSSDVDIFIHTTKEDASFEVKINKLLEEFYRSKKYKDYWELKGISNPIKLTIGDINKWKDIKNSIISNGVTLFDKYRLMPVNVKHKVIISWENIKPESKRVLLSKRLFGYKENKKQYPGLINKYEGEKLGKGSILIPNGHFNIFKKLFQEMKITIRIRKIVEYS